jgi:hypothetical protein
MSDNKLSIREFLKKWDANEYDNTRDSMCEAGWYDWFCPDTALYSRLQKMVPHIRVIANSPRINQDTMHVWFKNNCPGYGKLYDDFRICNVPPTDDESNLYVVSMQDGHYKSENYGKSELYDGKVSFCEPAAVGWDNIYRYFGVTRKGTVIKQKQTRSKPVKVFNRFAEIDLVV